jgi:hypothetical protein
VPRRPVAAALARPDLDAAVKRVVGLLLEHAGEGLADDVLLVLCQPMADPPSVIEQSVIEQSVI